MTGISIGWLARRRARKAAAGKAYAGLMKAALAPDFYLTGDVADTFEGRAGMVMVHAALALRRIKGIPGQEGARLAAALNTRVLDGFDAAYREQGVGDSSIARKVRKLAEAYYGLGLALTAALDETLEETRKSGVEAVLARNGVTESSRAAGLGAWLCTLADRLEAQQDSEILAGNLDWLAGAKVR
ncbi:ubiquinol-cytochrome C chaperone family protein [Hyphomonas chukchiensis]|uniref:ubiquinol-cytochrome C chaperone family protein n=1 Tax=Hyphomonas chukchiensis TaxID=1280947 RepID=UPI0030FB1B79